jgi:hypothetical protein
MSWSALTGRKVARAVGAAVVLVLAFSVEASIASAASSLVVTPSSAPEGGQVSISGNVPASGTGSCPAGDAVQLTSTAGLFPPDGFGPQATRDASGTFRVAYTIPAAAPPGTYKIGIRCGGGNVGVGAALQVTRPSAPATPAPSTASSTATTTNAVTTAPGRVTTPPLVAAKTKTSSHTGWIVLGVLVVLLGAGTALLLQRRRRRAGSTV